MAKPSEGDVVNAATAALLAGLGRSAQGREALNSLTGREREQAEAAASEHRERMARK